jgi:HPt (histidine-containing phosphotransfer) domain-containing protein
LIANYWQTRVKFINLSQRCIAVSDLLNTSSLDELRSVLGDEFFELSRMFALQVESEVAGLSECFAIGDIQRLRRLAHSLKGCSANMGVQELSRQASMIEKAAMANDTAVIESLLPAMAPLASESLRAMREAGYLPSTS